MSRILAADDNKMVRLFYESVLSYLGQEFEICKDGKEALEAFKREAADLVILDFDMPQMNGFECCKAIRSLPEGVLIPIVIVSSHDDEDHISRGLEAGASDYLVKPVKEAHLVAKLKNCLKVSAFRKGECDLIKERSVVGGRYRVERMLGSGSHSTVFLASDLQDAERPRALKMLKECASSEEISKPFFELAGRIKELQSGKIVKIMDLGQANGRLYAAMEFVDGGDLAGILKKRKKLGEAEAVRMACDIAKALEAFHSAGIIHLDLKPENILRDSATGGFKLADFGLITARSSATMPLNAEIWSTLAYVPPEYFSEDAEIGLQSDIYSLGVTLYQCITGDNPFLCERPAITMFRHMNFVPPLLNACDKAISSKTSALVASMMAKSMDARPTASEAVKALEDIIANPEAVSTKVCGKEVSSAKAAEVGASLGIDEVKEHAKAERSAKVKAARSEKTRHYSAALLMGALIAVICYLAGMALNKALFGYGTEPGAMISTLCAKCGYLDRRRVMDISKDHCAKCGGMTGYAMKCLDCRKNFPSRPAMPEGLDKAAEAACIEKAKTCPHCGSRNSRMLLQEPGQPPDAPAAKAKAP